MRGIAMQFRYVCHLNTNTAKYLRGPTRLTPGVVYAEVTARIRPEGLKVLLRMTESFDTHI